MEPVPLSGEDDNQDAYSVITGAFECIFCSNRYCRYMEESSTDGEVEMKEDSSTIIKIREEREARTEDICQVEEQIVRIQEAVLAQKQQVSEVAGCKEESLRLKRTTFFQNLPQHVVDKFNLIQKSDIYPDTLRRYLDFTFNPNLHTCARCPLVESKPTVGNRKGTKSMRKGHDKSPISALVLDVEEIIFKNYTVNRTYRQKIKLYNNSRHSFLLRCTTFPPDCPFTLEFGDLFRIAPGMCLEFTVIFKPVIYREYRESAVFKTDMGGGAAVAVTCIRDPPKLLCCIFNPFLAIEVAQPNPLSRYFCERRRDALNSTIDCGTCLLGANNLITIVMKNVGQMGKFFVTTEHEWYSSELRDSAIRGRQLTQGCFTFFPVFFEIGPGDVGELFVLFSPERAEMFTEKIYIICDNNSYQEMEVLGDAILYSRHWVKVQLSFPEDTFSYVFRLITITLPPFKSEQFKFIISNKSPVLFEYYWNLQGNNTEESKKPMPLDWIRILNTTSCLPSFSTTDVIFELTPRTEEEGVYSAFVSLHLKNVPASSFTQDALIAEKHTIEHVPGDTNVFNIIVNKLEVFCVVEKPNKVEEVVETVQPKMSRSRTEKRRLNLSQHFLPFGVLPIGVQAQRNLSVHNRSREQIQWKLVEIRWTENLTLELVSTSNLSRCCGTLRGGERQVVTYSIEARSTTRYISLLALFSSASCTCEDFRLEDMSMVTYEISEVKVSLRTDNAFPVLCPKGFVYVGIPTLHTVYVRNEGALTGCFYFLPLRGEEGEKIQVKFQPQSGVVPPATTVKVRVELLVLEDGLFENLYVPCFTGDLEKLISLKITCYVASISVLFHLPDQDTGFRKLIWPPREYSAMSMERSWQQCDGEWVPGEEGMIMESEEVSAEPPEPPDIDPSLVNLIDDNSVAATYPTVKVKSVQVKKPTRIRFYMENITPVRGKFTVDPTNYCPSEDCINHVLVKAKSRPPEYFWDRACLSNGYGIVVEPVSSSGDLVPYEVVEIELCIYANTWGKYLEEVIVEIDNLTPFCFNLIVEVVGSPIEFPFARNTTLKYPTLRFECINPIEGSTRKTFTVTNISSVPLHLSWYVFIPDEDGSTPFNLIIEMAGDTIELYLSRNYYGTTACPGCVQLEPLDFTLEKQATATVAMTINTCSFQYSCSRRSCLQYDLRCFVFLETDSKFKTNYFRRVCGTDLVPAKVEALITTEIPRLAVDVSSDDTTINFFVSNLLLKRMQDPEVYLVLRNVDSSRLKLKVDIDVPFYITQVRTVPTGITDHQNLVLHRGECVQMMLKCHVTPEEVMNFGQFIYKCRQNDSSLRSDDFIAVICKNLHLHQEGVTVQNIPFEVRLHFPRIEIKPTHIKFGQCLLYNTKKVIFTIYNMSGAPVQFEIYKSSRYNHFEANPFYGEIPASTGLNKQFIDVALYFTPKDCRLYLENLRVVTHIPYYFIDVTVTGHGTNNEKFYVV